MSCEDNVCGIGLSTTPKAGDPDNNISLKATPAYGGVDLDLTLPTTNPFAVAYYEVYRGLSEDFTIAIRRNVFSGSTYFDKADPNILYYYWVVAVSVNGTYGAPIGPASAAAMPKIGEMIELLTGQIDAGLLAQSLKSEIEMVGVLDGRIVAESQSRAAAFLAIQNLLTQTQANLDQAMTYMNQEITNRTEGDSALLNQINVMAASVNSNLAAIIEEKDIRISRDDAISGQLTTMYSNVGTDIAAAESRMQTQVSTVDGKVTSIGALYTIKMTVNGLAGGFGIYNDGSSVSAGFDVDQFWVGTTQANKRKPFIIKNGITYIDQAVIDQLTFDKLRAADGSVIVQNGKLQASYIQADQIVAKQVDLSSGVAGQPTTRMTNGLMQVFHGNGNLAVRLGIW